ADAPSARTVAQRIGATPAQVGLAWLLAHSPNTLLIAGTRSVTHLEDNAAAGSIQLDAEALSLLDAAGATQAKPYGAEPFLAAGD
ncbi:MAG: aldo/keto reductase, partial [Actinobacteria bacterium]|nr:aldo/keto reductase [Actinomycetota bacterium]